MISAEEYNARVREAARHQRLPSIQRPGNATFLSKWTVTCDPIDAAGASAFSFGINPLTGKPFFSDPVFGAPNKDVGSRLYVIGVGPGCVNDQPGCIEYLAKDDPRGWVMPADYPPYTTLQKVFGPNYKFVDRPLWSDGVSDPPYLLLTGPNSDASNLGGFVKTPDARRPPWFRTADAWEKDLYQASVLISITPYRADPASVNLAIGGARASRWRVVCGQPPASNLGSGVTGIAALELARIWLLRTPGKPQLDDVTVQQVVYWDLMARSTVDVLFLEVLGIAAAGVDLGLLALSLTGASAGLTLGVALLGLEAAAVSIFLDNIQSILAATSNVDFWNV